MWRERQRLFFKKEQVSYTIIYLTQTSLIAMFTVTFKTTTIASEHNEAKKKAEPAEIMWFHWGYYLRKRQPRGPQCSQQPVVVIVTARPKSNPLPAQHDVICNACCVFIWLCDEVLQQFKNAPRPYPCQWNKACWCQRFFFPLPSKVGGSLRWVTQLSKIAVTQFQDQTHTVNEKKGFESKGRKEASGDPPLNYPNTDEETRLKTHRKKKRERILMSKDFLLHCGYLEKRRKTRCIDTKAIFIRAWRGKSGHLRTEMRTKKGKLDALENNFVETSSNTDK